MRKITAVGLVFAALFSFTACDEEGSTTPTLGRTPAQVLEALERAFLDRDAELLGELLDTDFTFYFDQNDIGDDVGGYIIPVSWGREDMLTACGNMITEAYSIDIHLTTTQIEDPEEGSTEYVACNIMVRLLVMVDSMNGFQAQGPCDFGFVNDDSAGYDDWSIVDWWDRTAATGMFESTDTPSLGEILALYM
jgi:hypothetical protein